MGIRVGFGRMGGLARLTAASAVLGGLVPGAAEALPQAQPPDPQSAYTRAAGTWGACGSWWSETALRSESGSVCGVDGVVSDGGQVTQLAEPLVQVSRYVCLKRRPFTCDSENFSGTVRRSEMTVDPFLRRATIRGTLGGCALDVEFAGLGPAQPAGNLYESYGLAGGTPTISVGGNQTVTSQASWWGGVCGRTVAPPAQEQGSAWIFRGVEATLNGFGGEGGEGHFEG
jgi:hypothetical protein